MRMRFTLFVVGLVCVCSLLGCGSGEETISPFGLSSKGENGPNGQAHPQAQNSLIAVSPTILQLEKYATQELVVSYLGSDNRPVQGGTIRFSVVGVKNGGAFLQTVDAPVDGNGSAHTILAAGQAAIFKVVASADGAASIEFDVTVGPRFISDVTSIQAAQNSFQEIAVRYVAADNSPIGGARVQFVLNPWELMATLQTIVATTDQQGIARTVINTVGPENFSVIATTPDADPLRIDISVTP